jgi:hypothetical protein
MGRDVAPGGRRHNDGLPFRAASGRRDQIGEYQTSTHSGRWRRRNAGDIAYQFLANTRFGDSAAAVQGGSGRLQLICKQLRTRGLCDPTDRRRQVVGIDQLVKLGAGR